MKYADIEKIVLETQLRNSGVSADIDANKKFQVRTWINMAIQDINSRFMLIQNVITFKLDQHGDKTYDLPPNFMQIIDAFDYKKRRVAINKEDDPGSIYTPSPKKIIIPKIYYNFPISVAYVESHNWILEDDKINEELPLGNQFIKAIMHYVSYLAFESINDDPGYGHHLHLEDYERELAKLESLGYKPNESQINNNFYFKGFI